jgi:hypothetical protein
MTAVLGGYARTLLVPLVAVPVVLATWTLTAADGWPAAAAAVAAWALLTAAWLRRCRSRWSPVHVPAIAWVGPVAALAPAMAAGWLSPGGLVLWGPLAGVCALALALGTYAEPLIAGGRTNAPSSLVNASSRSTQAEL